MMRWTVHLEGGPRRVNHAAAVVGAKVYSFGGYCTGDNYKDVKPIDVFCLNAVNYRWLHINKPKPGTVEAERWPYQRYGHTVSAHNGKIYLFGGRNDTQPCNMLYCFDTTSNEWHCPTTFGAIPAARDGHSSCIFGDAMFIFGGYEDSIEPFRPDVYKLDLITWEWTLLKCKGEPPIYRDFHTATVIGDKMFIFGGRSDTTGHNEHHHFLGGFGTEFYSDKLNYLDISTLRWECPIIMSPRPSGRRSHSAITVDGQLLIFGGYNGRKKEHMNDLWLLDAVNWKWRALNPRGTGPNPRRRQALCRVADEIFLFGGTSPYDGPELYFSPDQQELMPDQPNNLIDHNDLYVLDLSPSLRTLCIDVVIKFPELFDISELPSSIRYDLKCMTTENNISKPLPLQTLPLG